MKHPTVALILIGAMCAWSASSEGANIKSNRSRNIDSTLNATDSQPVNKMVTINEKEEIKKNTAKTSLSGQSTAAELSPKSKGVATWTNPSGKTITNHELLL
jgi:hypothetical protein